MQKNWKNSAKIECVLFSSDDGCMIITDSAQKFYKIDFLNTKFENSNNPPNMHFFRNKFYSTVTQPAAAESHKGSSDVGGPDGPMTSLLLFCTGLIWGTEEV